VLSAPPGTAPVAVSERAFARFDARRTPRPSWYCDLGGLRDYWVDRTYHHTVPVNLHYALHAALRAALEEGMDVRARRVRDVGAALMEALSPLGFTPYVKSPSARLPTVLACVFPTVWTTRASGARCGRGASA
jgi:alanine-glyoxylate transaminase/serine-glyoxylate transaminase/serine-pyruvate transaminase